MKDKKVETEELIEKIRKKGSETVELGGEIKKLGQQAVDISDAMKPIIHTADSSNMDWELINHPLRNIEQALGLFGNVYPATIISTVASGVSTATQTMFTPRVLDRIMQYAMPGRENEMKSAALNLHKIVDRRAEPEKALKLLDEFDLSTAVPGQSSPTDLLKTAWAAFEDPAIQGDPSITSLIPMRECINAMLAILLKHRPEQEEAKDKILAIYKQLAKDETLNWQKEEMSEHWKRLRGELSGSKQKSITRNECGDKLREATLFLIDFLESLDQTKMRK